MQEPGKGILIITSLADRADGYFDATGARQSDGFFYKDEIAVYGEYGLNETYTVLARLAWQDVEQSFGQNYDQAEGVAASQLGLRRLLLARDRNVISVQGSVFLPGSGENIANQPLGEGERGYELRVLGGRSFGGQSFGDVQLAYRARDGRFLDEIHLDTGFGFGLTEIWRVGVSSFSVWSIESARPGVPAFEQHKLQFSLLRRGENFDVEIGLMATPAGESALDERALFLSTWRRF